MAGKFVYLALLLCVSQAVLGQTVEQARKEAKKTLDDINTKLYDVLAYYSNNFGPANELLTAPPVVHKDAVRTQYQTVDQMDTLAREALKTAKTPGAADCIKDFHNSAVVSYDKYFDTKFFQKFKDATQLYSGLQHQHIMTITGEAQAFSDRYVDEKNELIARLPSMTDVAEIQRLVQKMVIGSDRYTSKVMRLFVQLALDGSAYRSETGNALDKLREYSKSALILLESNLEACLH